MGMLTCIAGLLFFLYQINRIFWVRWHCKSCGKPHRQRAVAGIICCELGICDHDDTGGMA